MALTRPFGLIGGLGVGATVIYYRGITEGCTARGRVPRFIMTHADAPTALAHVQAGRMDALAAYLAGFAEELVAAGATALAIPAVTPHICRAAFKALVSVPVVDMLETTRNELLARNLKRIALFGTRFTIETDLFGSLDGFDVVRPRPEAIDVIHAIYLELATTGRTALANVARLRSLAQELVRQERVEAVVLAGTDLNLIFDEQDAEFPALDCAAAHIRAIIETMCGAEPA